MGVTLRHEEMRGGIVYLMRRTGFLLGEVLHDLEPHNENGIDQIDPDICPKLKKLLSGMRTKAQLPQSSFVESRWNPAVSAITDLYGTWNNLAGNDVNTIAERKNKITKLQLRRANLFGCIRNPTQEQVVNELTKDFFLGLWDGFELIATQHGEVFPRLQRHIKRERAKLSRAPTA